MTSRVALEYFDDTAHSSVDNATEQIVIAAVLGRLRAMSIHALNIQHNDFDYSLFRRQADSEINFEF